MRSNMFSRLAGLVVVVGLAGVIAAQAGDAASSNWTGSISAGADLTRGNSETLLYNGSVTVEKRTKFHEFKIGLEGNYGENETTQSNGVKITQANVNNARATAEYKWLFRGNAFLYVKGEISHDEIADIDVRVLVGPGLGYYVLRNDTQNLNVEAGASYLHERKGGTDDDRVLVRLAQRYELKIGKAAKFWEAVEYMPSVEDYEDFLFNGETGIESALTEQWSLKLTLLDKYSSRPAPGKKQNDLAVKTAISYKW